MGRLILLPNGHPLKYGYSEESLVSDNDQIIKWFEDKEKRVIYVYINALYVVALVKCDGGVRAKLCPVYIPRVLREVFIKNDKMPMQLGDICLLLTNENA